VYLSICFSGLAKLTHLQANNNTWTMTIPSGLNGNYVLRHEILALHSAGQQNGAQNYPVRVLSIHRGPIIRH